MNTNPDDAKLAMWLDDELQGEELAAMEAWAGSQPEQLAAREEVRRWKHMIAATVPASVEPPASEFFNARISKAIREPATDAVPPLKRGFSWQTILMPLAACAGMVLAFIAGARTQKPGSPEISVAGAPKAIPVEPILYTPDQGVDAKWFSGSQASVIVLSGVQAIPDSMDFSKTASSEQEREIDSTAGLEGQPEDATSR